MSVIYFVSLRVGFWNFALYVIHTKLESLANKSQTETEIREQTTQKLTGE